MEIRHIDKKCKKCGSEMKFDFEDIYIQKIICFKCDNENCNNLMYIEIE